MDRGRPDYQYLVPAASDGMFACYRRFLAQNTTAGRLMMIGARAGSATQITQVRIVAVNGRVWTGKGDETKVRFPALDAIPLREDRPDENMCSIAMRIRYGRFDYFTGRDMPGYPVPGAAAWRRGDGCRAGDRPDRCPRGQSHGSLEEENPF
jgi:hypothetical protein